jgi:hypothetical protein
MNQKPVNKVLKTATNQAREINEEGGVRIRSSDLP